MDRDGIEPVPLAADVMLSSSFRFADDSMIIGAKEIESYGINLNSGKVSKNLSLHINFMKFSIFTNYG